MALHRRVRRPRSLGRGRRSHAEGLDRRLRALSGSRVMSSALAAAATAAIPSIPRDNDGPVFRAPWEAHAFAMALTLHERGVFTWPEWAAALADEIKRAQVAGDPDTGETYYLHWLATLEGLVARKGVASMDTLHRYRDAWDHAADRTPHGKPIELRPEDFS
ncbi:nitrile hydratase accessory protein [Bradyrhizobium guangxiense]